MVGIHVIYPCECCADEDCGQSGCAKFETAAGIYRAARRLALTVRDSRLGETERQRIARIDADAITEALGECCAGLDRASFFEACGLPGGERQ